MISHVNIYANNILCGYVTSIYPIHCQCKNSLIHSNIYKASLQVIYSKAPPFQPRRYKSVLCNLQSTLSLFLGRRWISKLCSMLGGGTSHSFIRSLQIFIFPSLAQLFPSLALLLGIAFHLQLVLLSYPICLRPYHFLKLVSFLGANRTKSASVCPWLLRGAI